ncbi:hypothetical protein ACFSTE_13190 [Aquimarina hainanensis]|uniref:Uncharacterized protein n=1 Tax=Aquimarina hainanensis TaxID=1578017 RepID=A0ABW5N846_9FLAO
MTYTSSLVEPNTYFIFRESGTEVKVQITGTLIRSNPRLLEEEEDYVSKYIANKTTPTNA